MKVIIDYKADFRLRLVQVTTGNLAFLVNLDLFKSVVRPEDLYDNPKGTARISVPSFNTLHRGKE